MVWNWRGIGGYWYQKLGMASGCTLGQSHDRAPKRHPYCAPRPPRADAQSTNTGNQLCQMEAEFAAYLHDDAWHFKTKHSGYDQIRAASRVPLPCAYICCSKSLPRHALHAILEPSIEACSISDLELCVSLKATTPTRRGRYSTAWMASLCSWNSYCNCRSPSSLRELSTSGRSRAYSGLQNDGNLRG
jgi:hypothetical protein